MFIGGHDRSDRLGDAARRSDFGNFGLLSKHGLALI
jgi:hypothetical protein